MTFGLPLQLERIPQTDKLKVLREYTYYWKRNDITIVVPVGYEIDQASIPKLVLPILIDNTGKITNAAVPHDYGYTHLRLKGWTKVNVDRMCRDAMIEAGLKIWRAYSGWIGVKANIIKRYKWAK